MGEKFSQGEDTWRSSEKFRGEELGLEDQSLQWGT
jgi:hypothetical protein